MSQSIFKQYLAKEQLILKYSGKDITVGSFNKSIAKVEKYAKSISFKLVFTKLKTIPGTCNYFNYTIKVSSMFARKSQLATALHELGHAIEDETGHEAYWNAVRNKGLSEAERDIVRERLAWEHGERFAKKNGIKLGSWFYSLKKIALETYKTKLKTS